MAHLDGLIIDGSLSISLSHLRQMERSFRTQVQEELTILRKELFEQRKHSADTAKLRQENEALKEKIARQEAYLRRKIMKDKTGGAPAEVMVNYHTPLEDDHINKLQHLQRTPGAPVMPSAAATACVGSSKVSSSSSTYKTPSSSSASKASHLLREDKENHYNHTQYRSTAAILASASELLLCVTFPMLRQ